MNECKYLCALVSTPLLTSKQPTTVKALTHMRNVYYIYLTDSIDLTCEISNI